MPRARRWSGALLLMLLALLAPFSVAGYFTVGMMQAPGYRTAAWVYIGLFALSLSGLLGVLV
jgi:hypothetical protein